MAIKIDLLPGYVKLTKRFRFTITAAILGLGLWTGGLLLAYHSRQLVLQTALEDRRVADAKASETTTATDAVTAANNAAAGYNAANNFMLASTKSGSERSALLNLITQYIYENSVVKSIDISDGRTVTIVATVTTPDEYGQFLLRLRNARGVVFAGDPRMTTTAVGGFGNGAYQLVVPHGEAGGAPIIVNYPITLTAVGTLLNPLTVPPDPTGGAGAAPGGAGGTRIGQ